MAFSFWLFFASIFVHLPMTDAYLVESLEDVADVRLTPRGVVIFLPDVTFAFGSDHLTRDAKVALRAVVDLLNTNGVGSRIAFIEGHTDAVGTEAANYALGLRRAKAVQDELHRAGLSQRRTLIDSKGEDIPISSDPAKNRRVEILLIRQ